MIIGIGNDIVEICRFEKAGPNLAARLFSPAEQSYIAARSNKAQTMAGLFAAKEAIAKALGTGFQGFWPSEIEIIHNESGRPTCAFRGYTWHISISHAAGLAVAVAIAEKDK